MTMDSLLDDYDEGQKAHMKRELLHHIVTEWTQFPCFFTNNTDKTQSLSKLDVRRVASVMENLDLQTSGNL